MSDTTERVAEPPGVSMADLGIMLETACARDAATGVPHWSPAELADAFHRSLRPWIDGEGTLDVYRLTNALTRSIQGRTAWEEHERRTASRWLSAEAQLAILQESLNSGSREVSFVLSPGTDGRFTNPRVSMRGHSSGTYTIGCDVGAGDLVLHTHPSGHLEPSDVDMKGASDFAALKPFVGQGIVSLDGSRLYLMRDPNPVPAEAST